MILLISQDSLESSTNDVEDWLYTLKAPFIRVNGSDLLKMRSSHLELSNDTFSHNFILTDGRELDVSKITIVWYRRWQNFQSFSKVNDTGDLYFEKELNEYRENEFKALSKIFFSLLLDKPFVGSSAHLHKLPSKLEQLKAAKNANLQIPASLITDSKSKLLDFFYKHGQKIISKANSESPWIKIKGKYYAAYTCLIEKELIDFLPSTFFPTLFQEFSSKEVELRVFYLYEKCYAMAIFSTLDEQTEVDFRRYNLKKPNRYVPFNLPDYVQERIIKFMKIVDLNTGSLDFILTKSNDFIFLEVNPGGQFGMVSLPCNYYLEEIVAKKLIEQNIR